MKRTYLAAAVMACAAAPAMAADYYYYPAGTTVVAPVAVPVVHYYQDPGTISFVQQRLLTSGYNHVSVNGVLDSATIEALRDFQHRHGFSATGSIDQRTIAALGGGRTMSGSAGSVPVVLTTPAPAVIVSQPRSDVEAMPRNYEGSPGNNLGSLGTNREGARWSANY